VHLQSNQRRDLNSTSHPRSIAATCEPTASAHAPLVLVFYIFYAKSPSVQVAGVSLIGLELVSDSLHLPSLSHLHTHFPPDLSAPRGLHEPIVSEA